MPSAQSPVSSPARSLGQPNRDKSSLEKGRDCHSLALLGDPRQTREARSKSPGRTAATNPPLATKKSKRETAQSVWEAKEQNAPCALSARVEESGLRSQREGTELASVARGCWPFPHGRGQAGRATRIPSLGSYLRAARPRTCAPQPGCNLLGAPGPTRSPVALLPAPLRGPHQPRASPPPWGPGRPPPRACPVCERGGVSGLATHLPKVVIALLLQPLGGRG